MNYTVGQENAINAVWALLADPKEKYLIIEGPAGVGKSEIINKIAKDFNGMSNSIRKLTSDKNIADKIMVTATTNKAVDALQSKGIEKHLQGERIITVYSGLAIKPLNGKLVRTRDKTISRTLILIDESSFIGDELLEYIDIIADDTCKIVFIGDPYQLPPINKPNSPVYDYGIKTVSVDEVMRNTGSIQKLSLELRELVKGGPFPKLVPDNKQLFLIDDVDEFIDLWLSKIKSGEVTKLIGFENDLVHEANAIAKEELENKSHLAVGDIVVCNYYVPHPIRQIKTDSEVVIMGMQRASSLGYVGHNVALNLGITVFVPDNPEAFTELKKAPLTPTEAKFFETRWADLRPNYSCTIHKSQGSTYRNVFINLNELSQLSNDNDLARLLYVAVSRASHQVYFTGTL